MLIDATTRKAAVAACRSLAAENHKQRERIAALEAERVRREADIEVMIKHARERNDRHTQDTLDLAAARQRIAELEAERDRLLSDARKWEQAALIAWAVDRWGQEVSDRPLVNVHRRTLDDTWRQVIRYAGGDPVELLGPAHDDLLAAGKEEKQP